MKCCDDLRIISADRNHVSLLEHLPSRLDPVSLRFELFGFYKGLGTDLLQHVPVALGFTSWVVNRIGPIVMDRSPIILLFREMTGADVQPGYWCRPIGKCFLIPRLGNRRLERRALGLGGSSARKNKDRRH